MTLDVCEYTFITEHKTTFQYSRRVDNFGLAEWTGGVCMTRI